MRLSMREIRDILRLRHEVGLSCRGIAHALNIGYGTVVDYLKRAAKAEVAVRLSSVGPWLAYETKRSLRWHR